MEHSTYYLDIQMYCQDKYINIATFDLSSCTKIVDELFKEFQGENQVAGNRLLRINLMLNKAGNTAIVGRSINCTLDELAENSKIIIKKTFRTVNFD